jgi:acyl-CoA thioesterase-1
MTSMPMQARRLRLNSVWGCKIGRLALAACLILGFAVAGCSSFPQANANIAFMGDSITYFWWLPKTNFGVPGDTTAEMLARFPAEILAKNYKAVVILGGTNDIRNTSQSVEQEVDAAIDNIGQMAAIAEKDDMVVVLCKIPPISGADARVVPLNAAIASYAMKQGYKLVDYYTPMEGHSEYFKDGIHPNYEGYFAMRAALTPVIPLDF